MRPVRLTANQTCVCQGRLLAWPRGLDHFPLDSASMAAALGDSIAGTPWVETMSPVRLTVAVKFCPLLIGRFIGSVSADTLTCNRSNLGNLCFPFGTRITVLPEGL